MARVIGIDDATTKDLPGRRSREIVGADVGAQQSTVRLVEIDPVKPGVPLRGPHVHMGFEESIHVLQGEGTTCTETGEYHVRAGDTVLVPSGEKHATYNTGSTVLRLLCFFPINDIGPGTTEFLTWDQEVVNGVAGHEGEAGRKGGDDA
jgi:uncharacterized cupin superfamily protein